MRKMISSLLWAAVSGVMLLSGVSCEKMTLSDKADEEANVVLSVCSIEQTPFKQLTRATLADVCTRLNFIIFDKDGVRVDQKNQELGDDGFGQAGFTLPLGDYRLVIVAHSAKGNPTVNKRSSSKNESVSFSNANGFTDTFFASQDLTVGEDGVSLEVNLTRIVALIRFINVDPIPVKADSVRFYYKGGSGSLDALSGWGNVNSEQYAGFGKGRLSAPYEIYTIPWQDKESLDVTVSTYEHTDLLTSTDIKGIPIRRNSITTCRGAIFDGKVARVQIVIQAINDEWGTPIEYEIPVN
jgi:hypothetical protein